MRNFKENEFFCPCCDFAAMADYFTGKIDNARDIAGVPFIINSGYRCEAHNKAVGGKPDSAHRYGLACDIKCTHSRPRFKIVGALIKAGISRIGIGKTFIHADDDTTKDTEVTWLY